MVLSTFSSHREAVMKCPFKLPRHVARYGACLRYYQSKLRREDGSRDEPTRVLGCTGQQ